jgi:hypothetical protein
VKLVMVPVSDEHGIPRYETVMSVQSIGQGSRVGE